MKKLIKIDIYNDSFYLLVGSAKQAKDLALKHGEIVEFEDWYGGMVISNNNFPHILWLPSWKNSILDQTNLSHEVVHLAHQIIERTGIYYSLKDDEVFAYLVGYITKKCLLALKKNKKKK